jgi:hypothetical protein
MPIQSLNSNDKLKSLADGDNLSATQKKSLLDQYNTNISPITSQLGYLPTYGATTNPSRSAVSVVASAYDTSGNGGRKLVRLANGNLISVVWKSPATSTLYLYKSTDNGATWTQLCSVSSMGGYYSIATNGSKVYLTGTNDSSAFLFSWVIDPSTQTNVDIRNTGNVTVDSGQTTFSGLSNVYSSTDNTLHAAWASKNSTYPNSYNIRYAKGTIASDGSVTWGSVTQVTTASTTGSDSKYPSVVMSGTNPLIIYSFGTSSSSNQQIKCYNVSNSTTTNVYSVTSTVYTQSNPSATVDGTGAIHVVWHGLDATDTSVYNIRYSKSTDGGVTWSAMTKLTTGNTYDQWNASITYDQNNNLYVYFEGGGASWTGMRIRSLVYNGSWSSVVDITSNTTGVGSKFASLCDNIRTFTSPLVIWQDNVSPSVKFSGTWTDTPLLSETTSISAVSNKALIDAYVNGNFPTRKRYASGTVTSSSGTSSFTFLGGGTGSFSTATVTGLTFKPTTIIYYYTQGAYTVTLTYSTTQPFGVLVAPQQVGYASGGGTTTTVGISGPIIAGGALSVISGSFVIPVSSASISVSYLAIE